MLIPVIDMRIHISRFIITDAIDLKPSNRLFIKQKFSGINTILVIGSAYPVISLYSKTDLYSSLFLIPVFWN